MNIHGDEYTPGYGVRNRRLKRYGGLGVGGRGKMRKNALS